MICIQTYPNYPNVPKLTSYCFILIKSDNKKAFTSTEIASDTLRH